MTTKTELSALAAPGAGSTVTLITPPRPPRFPLRPSGAVAARHAGDGAGRVSHRPRIP
ncbi:Uncharacterised protein [Amycolatopsis camponoti]|uniref:Uncharacterized protein n=1 Tax=Amycolatopsis camponoti TaxID=2606593 RepID=A0A6I8LY00_9PSEU|nr:Uncharacterised protein [Amycolatopsis camponoti]